MKKIELILRKLFDCAVFILVNLISMILSTIIQALVIFLPIALMFR